MDGGHTLPVKPEICQDESDGTPEEREVWGPFPRIGRLAAGIAMFLAPAQKNKAEGGRGGPQLPPSISDAQREATRWGHEMLRPTSEGKSQKNLSESQLFALAVAMLTRAFG